MAEGNSNIDDTLARILTRLDDLEKSNNEKLEKINVSINEIKGRLDALESPRTLTRQQRAEQAFPRGSRQSTRMETEHSITGPLGRSRFSS